MKNIKKDLTQKTAKELIDLIIDLQKENKLLKEELSRLKNSLPSLT